MKLPAFLLTLAMALGCIASARAQYDAQWNSYSAPTYAEPNQTVTITATVQNTGTATWNPPASGNDFYVQLSDNVGTHLGYVQVNGVAPGQTATVSFNVTIPNIGGNGTATYHLQMMENGIQYFGAIQDVPIIIDYPPTTSLSVSTSNANLNDSVTVTSTTSDVYPNVINQAIDYIPGSGGDWVSGTDAAGTRWDGSATASDQISPSFSMSSTGTWQFRARGQDSEGQLSDFQFVNVTVQQPNTPPTASISASATSINTNQSVTFTISATDPDNNLDGMNMDIRSPQPSGYFNIAAGPYSYDGGATPNNGYMSFPATGSNSQQCTITFTQPGTYVFVGSAQDPSGWYYSSGNATITVSTPTYTLTTNVSPAGAGSVSGSGTYSSGATATVTASANAGYVFNNWSGDASGTSASASVTINGNKSVTANFTAIPVITSPSTATGTVNTAFTYTITASNNPASFDASGLPPNVTVNRTTGVISGTPTSTGTYTATISAINGPATGSATLTITIGTGTVDDTTNQNELNIHLPY